MQPLAAAIDALTESPGTTDFSFLSSEILNRYAVLDRYAGRTMTPVMLSMVFQALLEKKTISIAICMRALVISADDKNARVMDALPTLQIHIVSKLSDLPVDYDRNRLEQELIYYIEKLDINEEKVRLRQHCKYFLETFEEENPGKKLGFIAQEMGREINTTGSKANHAEIQKIVVRMKDELEKIKEQTLNTL